MNWKVRNMHYRPSAPYLNYVTYTPLQSHKDWCNKNVEHAAALANADASGYTHMLGVPQGLTLTELDEKLEKWVKVQNSLLMAATIHKLALPRDLKRSHSYMLRVTVSYRPDNDGVPAKFFRVNGAKIIDFVSARALGGVWPVSIDHIAKMREESESARRGTVAAIGLECDPLPMQVVPFGSLRDLSPLRIQQNWKAYLSTTSRLVRSLLGLK
jgi:mitochondrial splicing suppressor protein 51